MGKKYIKDIFFKHKILLFAILILVLIVGGFYYLYEYKSLFLFRDMDRFWCSMYYSPIPKETKTVSDTNLYIGQREERSKGEDGIKRRCYNPLALSSYIMIQKNPADRIIAEGIKLKPVDRTLAQPPNNSQMQYHQKTTDCYTRTIPYQTVITYEEGYLGGTYTIPGMNGWEMICGGKIVAKGNPMNEEKTIIIEKELPRIEYNVPKPKNRTHKSIKTKVCKKIKNKHSSGYTIDCK